MIENREFVVFGYEDTDKAFAKAQQVLAEDRMNEEDFRDLYGGGVTRDRAFVEKRKQNFAEQDRKDPEGRQSVQLSSIFEAIIDEQGELSDWFGPSALTTKTSEFDDIVNGIDTIVEFEEGDQSASHLALAVDVTYAHNLEEKIRRIKEEIESGDLAKIKYFSSDRLHFRGELKHVPKTVVCADMGTVKNLAKLWLGDKNRELGKHPVQFQILEEILVQCGEFARFAREIGKEDIAERYEKTARIVRGIYDEKEKTLKDSKIRDGAFERISDLVKNLRPTGHI